MFPYKTIVIDKTITSSNILTSVQDLTSQCYGDFFIKNIVLKTDSVGLAGGTNLVVSTTNSTGLVNVLVEAVSNLGANKTVDISSASVTKQPTVLENGSKIQLSSTVGACTGAGTVTIYIFLEALALNSYIQ
jgi:hypothetical protein